MRRRSLLLLLVVVAASCRDNGNGTPGDGAGTDRRGSDGTIKDGSGKEGAIKDGSGKEGAIKDGSPRETLRDQDSADRAKPNCTATGATCSAPSECCSGVCTNNLCAVASCAPASAPCKLATDCCNLNCTGGLCGGTACVSDGQSCTTGGTACCSTQCVSGSCKPLNPTCKTAGNACAPTDACCSGSCVGGVCSAPSQVSYCTQVGDICFKDNECCTGVCAGGSATSAGTCAAITTSCLVDGLVCSGCTGCCSSFCAPFGSNASKICQPASGCHVTGDLCQKDSDCCGGDPTQIGPIPGAGLIRCVPDPKYPQIGTCSDPNPNNCPTGQSCGNACVPEGNVCHYKGNGGCPSNSIRNDCCSAPGNKGECKLDLLGIPRCYGLAACVPPNGACASSADCCNALPCVPDATGHLKCGTSCIPQGGTCTTTADCCTGLPCTVPPGSLKGTCAAPPPPPPPPPSDGGVKDQAVPSEQGTTDKGAMDKGTMDKGTMDKTTLPDAPPKPWCALYGQSCSTTVPCCVNHGVCRTPYPAASLCAAGQTNCTCFDAIL